jgi:phosphate transport system protein
MTTIRRRYEHDLDAIRADVQYLGSRVQTALLDSVDALKRRDLEASQQVISGDAAINDLHHKLEAECMRIIAMQQPLAGDLRCIAAALYITAELERIADYAKTIAKLNLRIGDEQLAEPLINIPRMAELSVGMLDRALLAYADRDTDLARTIPADDDEIDALYDRVFRRAMSYVQTDPVHMDQMNYLIMVAYSLERTADRVINMCERIIYMVEGEVVDLDEDAVVSVVV